MDLTLLLDSWTLHLRAERKSQETVKSYTDGVRGFLRWCAAEGTPAVLDRPTVNAWIADVLANGAEAATARARQLSVRRLSAWLAEEGEIERDELLSLKPPRLDVKVVPVLTAEQLTALIKACAAVSAARSLRHAAPGA
jgi:site-specific recombinase XerD